MFRTSTDKPSSKFGRYIKKRATRSSQDHFNFTNTATSTGQPEASTGEPSCSFFNSTFRPPSETTNSGNPLIIQPSNNFQNVTSNMEANANIKPSINFSKGMLYCIKKSWLLGLNCKICNNILSVGPVLLRSDGTNVCGRCSNSTDEGFWNNPYERLASKEMFPCIYEGCIDALPWNEVKKHEEVCSYKPDRCIIENCDWKKNKRYLIEHFKEKHRNLYIENNEELELDLSDNRNLKFLNRSLNIPFVIEVIYDKATCSLKFLLYYLGPLHKIRKLNATITLRDAFDNKLQRRFSDIPEYGSDSSSLHNSVTVDNVFSFVTEFKAFCSFKIVTEQNRFKSEGRHDFEKIECKECKSFIYDSLHVCKENILCKNCMCPCTLPIKYITLNDFQKIGEDEFVPCKNADCPFEVKKANFNEHIVNCEFNIFKCERCTFLGRFGDIKEHCLSKYSAKTGNEHLWNTSLSNDMEHVELILNNSVFYFTRRRLFKPQSVFCSSFHVKTISLNKDAKIRYRVELIHNTDEFLNLTIEAKAQKSGFIGELCVEEQDDLLGYISGDNGISFRITVLMNS